ncbi:FAD:protein FMN transferase [Lactococcus formosensis]|uniref:FAD:protein FMN transferase n=1 Tax=Lactococcus formosensis TaxID=1281486 RepID=UPI002434852D|nr:FAD:protein FMN transferase [Lactococcus formosensis]MDG6125550.1 FAD:protein FMN transferase [Lactococcus formosensis]MDG6186614.1 FAD:protein FMN transferase [Lactococcus formosensis]MDG6188676.1 FAD:protein FMN transferase [Lactococcus formosensis]
MQILGHRSMNDFLSQKYRGLGTVIELSLLDVENSETTVRLDQAYRKIVHYEDLFTVNRALSELMTVNQAAGVKAVALSEEVYDLTKKAIQVSQEHFGFNASIGPLVSLWHIGFADARVPSEQEIQKMIGMVSPDDIVLDDQQKTVFLPQKGMSLDLGGIAKGYIADKVVEFWKEIGLSTGIVNLGGNIRFLGRPLKGYWRVGIRNPLTHGSSLVLQVLTASTSVVTSGIDQRYLERDGKSYHHILNPETGYPHVNNLASVTIFSEKSLDGEIEAKRLFFSKEPEKVFAKRQHVIQAAVLITKDKEIKILGLKPKDVRLIDKHFKIIN